MFPRSGILAPEKLDLREQEISKLDKESIKRNGPPTTDEILAERDKEYGAFESHAKLTIALESTFAAFIQQQNPEAFKILKSSPYMVEGLHMIFHKLGRLGNGNIKHIDSWDDIAGYAKLVADILQKEKEF